MNALQAVAKEGLIERFLSRMGLRPGEGVDILENPTEDLIESIERGGDPVVYSMAKKRKLVRKEENYLWSTRRFPNNTANDTIGTGTIAKGDYPFFGNGVGDQGSSMGYASVPNLTFHQTNMDKGGKVPTGRGFALFELAASFNATALPQDIAQLLDTMELRYSKNNDDFTLHHGLLKLWPGGTGVNGFAGLQGTSIGSQVIAENGVPTMAAVRRFRQPRMLNANESFTYIVNANDVNWKDNTAIHLSHFCELTLWLFGFHFVRVTG